MVEADRIGFVHTVSTMVGLYVKLVSGTFPHARNEAAPNPGPPLRMQWMTLFIPMIEVSDYGNGSCVRCPNIEERSGLSVSMRQVRAQFFVKPVMGSLVEKVQVRVGEHSRCVLVVKMCT